MPNLRKLNGYEINWMKMSTVSFTSISNLVKNIYVSSHKRNVITVIRNRSNSRSHGNSGERANCQRFIFGHHTEQQQVHKIKFKCHLNVLHLKKKDSFCPERKNSCMFRESGFRKSSPTAVYLFTSF